MKASETHFFKIVKDFLHFKISYARSSFVLKFINTQRCTSLAVAWCNLKMIKRFWCIKFQKLLFFIKRNPNIYIILTTYLNDINTVCVKETRLFPVSFGRYMPLPWVTLEGQDVMALQLLTENSICDQSERHNHGNYCCLSSSSPKLTRQKGAIDSLSSHCHGDIIAWKFFPHYWPFLLGIHRSAVDSLNKGQWCGALMFLCLVL